MNRYAVRRVNPFRGVMRVVDIGDARALSVDALNWELQVKVERPVGWGSLNLGRTETLYSRYGVWSAPEGLASFPVHPTLERRRVHRAAEQLVDVLAAGGGGAAALGDRYERWLLDGATNLPLALLATATEESAGQAPLHWRAAPSDDGDFDRERREAMDRMVSRRGGTAAWFERQADGSGRRVSAGASRVVAADAVLPAEAFPELLLSTQWPQADAARVADYFDWLAPRLLMLPLAAATRARFERAAAARADEVAQFFRLYPELADVQLINSLRVQARLVQAG